MLQTGELEREKIPLLKKLKLLFLFNYFTEWIDATHAMRLYIHDQSIKEGGLYVLQLLAKPLTNKRPERGIPCFEEEDSEFRKLLQYQHGRV
jgi:hypothetical protein